MTSRCWMCLCRLAVYISLINIVIVSVMLLRNNNCAFTDCVNVPTAPRDDRRSSNHTNGGNITCYDSNVGTPAHGDDEEGMRRYNCPTPRFSDVPLASTALASSPGSGSTWLRHLLQKATGVYTGSVYHDTELEKAGFLGENVTDSRVVVIKTHREMELRKYDRAILIIRDPYDAIVSEYNWRVCGNHLGRAYSHVYNTTTWHEFVNKSAECWHRVNSRWLNEFQGVVQIVFYGDMVSDLATSLRTILAFLDVPETRVYCALRSPNGSFKRKSTNVVSRELFTYAQRRTIDGYQESVYEFVTQQQARLRARMLQK